MIRDLMFGQLGLAGVIVSAEVTLEQLLLILSLVLMPNPRAFLNPPGFYLDNDNHRV